MKNFCVTLFFCLFLYSVKAQTYFVEVSSAKGKFTMMLFDTTPLHRDNFLKAIKTGLFKGNEFNRVIKNFVSQAGELDETILDREQLHPDVPIKRVAAEIKPSLFHKKGALGAGRNDNPKKESYLNQFYIVQGKIKTDDELNAIEAKTGRPFSKEQRQVYKTIGGTPQLDGDYTIFGEVVSGLNVAEAINAVATNPNDLPLEPVKFTLRILTKNQYKKATTFKD